MMRKRHFTPGVIILFVLCVIIVLLAVGAIPVSSPRPAPVPPATATAPQISEAEELPAPAPLQTAAPPSPETQASFESEKKETPDPPAGESPGLSLSSLPVRMRIPALSLDYEIQPSGADESGNMVIIPALSVISWFELSSIPGNAGNSIMGGHNTWRGERSMLFTLDELEIGSEMEIEYSDGTSLRFLLESVFVYKLETAPADLIMDYYGQARVTLITCKGPFNSSKGTSENRIVATFKEESVFVLPDPPITPFPPLEPE